MSHKRLNIMRILVFKKKKKKKKKKRKLYNSGQTEEVDWGTYLKRFMATYDLAKRGAKASAGMVLTLFQNILDSVPGTIH